MKGNRTLRRMLGLLLSMLCLLSACAPALADAGAVRALPIARFDETLDLASGATLNATLQELPALTLMAGSLEGMAMAQAKPAILDAARQVPDTFVRVDLLVPDVVLDMRYAGNHNFVGSSIDGYEAPVALLTRPAAQALARVADALRPSGLRLCIYDAYRPLSAVEHFKRWAQDDQDTKMKTEFYPSEQKDKLFAKGYIAEHSSHSRGSCVDVTLVNAEGAPLDMGGTFDLFSPISSHNAKGLTGMQRMNRKLLRTTMEKQGFRSYNAEWWHYTLKDEPFPKTSFSFPVQDRVKIASISRYISNQFYNTTNVINIPPENSSKYEIYYQRYLNSRNLTVNTPRGARSIRDFSRFVISIMPRKDIRYQAIIRPNTLKTGQKSSRFGTFSTLNTS